MKVKNFKNRNGNAIPNQFIISDSEKIVFQSYNSVIAIKYNDGKIILGKNWDYSVTTGKYRNMFLQEDKKDTQKKINDGIYTIDYSL
jgi:hypothetical protein